MYDYEGHDPTETIDTYYDYDKVDLAIEGLPGYILTKDGKIWSNKTYNNQTPGWVRPTSMMYRAVYNLRGPDHKVKCVNVDALVSKYFITPTMLSMPEHFKRLDDGPLIVSDSGVVFDSKTGRFRNPSKGGNYLHICDRGKYQNLHRVVARLFIPNPQNKPCINHKNFNRWDNRAENLEWCTAAENNDASRDAGRVKHDGSVRRSEASMYKKTGVKIKRLGVTAMLVHTEGPNWTRKEK